MSTLEGQWVANTTTLIDLPCRTLDHARTRVYCARVGSLANATTDYITELQNQLRFWIREVDQEMANRILQGLTQEETQDATP